MKVLFVCTANICRSAMAAALFMKSAHEHNAVDAVAASGGFLEGGRKVHEHVTTILDSKGIDVSQKRSQRLSADVVEPADLILTMTSEHARGVVSQFPRSISDVYTLRHFGSVVTPRPRHESTREWLASINTNNRRAYLGDDVLLDIPDPIGHPIKAFEGLATELENTISWIMQCAYPASARLAGQA